MNTRILSQICLVLVFALGVGTSSLMAQTPHKVCGTDELHAANMEDPALKSAHEASERDYVSYMENFDENGQRTAGVVKTIPVVVHIVQSSAIETVTDAEVMSQLEVLNEDFRRMVGTPGEGNGVDTEYEFCLASIDPSGCPTTGINRLINPGLAYHQQSDAYQFKGLIQWNPYRYLNIWVPRTIETMSGVGQVIGYATFPTQLNSQPNLDGVVIHSEYFGRNASPIYGGRTATHELGHWLGLYHTFQGACSGATASNCNAGGDGVCDTPQAFEPNFGCPSINSCTDSPVDDPDQIENYMDYSNGTCQDMYTQGQKTRIDYFVSTFRSNLVSAANMTATGCDGTVSPGCAPTAEFSADVINACVGQTITFSDLSSGPASGWNWTFNGGSPSTSTAANPTVTYNAPGIYSVSLVASNALGNDTESKPGFIKVSAPGLPPLTEGFESVTTVPADWYRDELIGTSPWTIVNGVGYTGNKAMMVNNYAQGNAGAFANLTTSVVDLTSAPGAQLDFWYAYKRYNGFQIDTFQVRVSSNCGASWNTVWQEGGLYLPTVAGNAIVSQWQPTAQSQWRNIVVDLDSFAGEPDFRIQFKVISADGQALYLDDVNLTGLVATADPNALDWSINVLPNPVSDRFRVDFELPIYSEVRFTLLDLQGRTIFSELSEELAPGQHAIPFEGAAIESLASGTYFLRAESQAGVSTRKIVRMGE